MLSETTLWRKHADCGVRLLYFASIFVPCALPPRKEEVGVEDVFEKKSVDTESIVYSESDDHVHDAPSVPGPWATRSAII